MTDNAHKPELDSGIEIDPGTELDSTSKLDSKFGISIRAKLMLLAGVLLSALVGSGLLMRAELASGSDAIQTQGEVLTTLNTTTTALREFGEMKYWLADLQASWQNESEENAETAKARLFTALAKIEKFAPEEVTKIKTHVEKFVERSLSAVDAFTEENRVLGNSRLADARGDVLAVDKLLVGIAGGVKQGAETAKVSAIAGADQAIKLSLIVMIVTGAFAALLTWLTVRAVINPIKRMVIAMTELANGNKDLDLPAISKDEIGDMTKAVQILRDNAVEAERLAASQAEMERRQNDEDERRAGEKAEEEARRTAEALKLAEAQAELERREREEEKSKAGEAQKMAEEQAERERQEREEEARRIEAQRETEELQRLEEVRQTDEKRGAEAAAEAERQEAEQRARSERRQAMLDLADGFESQVGGVIETVTNASTQMQSSAQSMSANAEQTSEKSMTVASASDEASSNVHDVAASAEQLALSIQEISRQVAHSASIARNAVNQAQSTNDKVQGGVGLVWQT